MDCPDLIGHFSHSRFPPPENGLLENLVWLYVFWGTKRRCKEWNRDILWNKSLWKCVSSSVEMGVVGWCGGAGLTYSAGASY